MITLLLAAGACLMLGQLTLGLIVLGVALGVQFARLRVISA